MNILIIHHALTLGGIETLLVKLCKQFKKAGHHVNLIIEKGGHSSLTSQVTQQANVLEVKSLYELFIFYRRYQNLAVDYIYCVGPLQMLIGLWLKQMVFKRSHVLIGTYHPREYYSSKANKPYLQKIIEALVNQIPDQNIMFMNSACKEQHTKGLGRTFENSAIIPIPIEVNTAAVKAKSSVKRIISIGRIVNFKRYNFAMIEVMEELLAKGYALEYHIYGEGEEYASLRQAIENSTAQKNIFLHGNLDYSHLAEVLSSGYLFIGMGTTVLEAVSLGLPALIAIESETKALTYGFFGQVAVSNLGEKSDSLVRYSIVDKLNYLLSLDEESYQQLIAQGQNQTKAFQMDQVIRQYLQFYANSIDFAPPAMLWILSKLVALNSYRYLKKILGFKDPLQNRYLDHSIAKDYE